MSHCRALVVVLLLFGGAVADDPLPPGAIARLGDPRFRSGGAAFAFACDYRVVADEYRELDGERVLVLMQHGGYGRASGLGDQQLRTEGANVFHIREGKVTRLVLYWHRDRALSDLGMDG